ncbi:MAG: CvpA family protein [Flavobacteriales bacterium]|nr:CvpA family protein [Flavobacteriales bacterium]
MNYLDIVIAIPLLYGLIKGFTNGLIKEITGLLGLIIGVYVALNLSSYLHPKFEEVLGGYEQFIPIISFATLFIVSVLMIKILGYIIDKLTKALALGFVSRILGAIFGFLKVVVIFSFLLAIVSDYDLINKNTQDESVLLNPIQEVSDLITPEINKHKTTILDKVEKSADEVKNKLNNSNSSE